MKCYYYLNCIFLFVKLINGLNVVKVGGLFSPLSSNISSEREAAFLLAIKHLNDKSDGVYDNLLPNTILQAAVQIQDSNIKVLNSLSYLSNEATFPSPSPSPSPGVDILISSLDSSQTSYLDLISSSNVGVLSATLIYDFEGIRLTSEKATQGLLLQRLICQHFQYQQISVFSSSDSETFHPFVIKQE